MLQSLHELCHVLRDSALGVSTVILCGLRLDRAAVLSQIWTDDGEPGIDELQCRPVLGCSGGWVAV